MLTEGVGDASTAMHENVKALPSIHVWIKRNALSISGSRTRFSKYSMSGSPYFVDVELIQIEKRITLCYVLLSCAIFQIIYLLLYCFALVQLFYNLYLVTTISLHLRIRPSLKLRCHN